MEFSKLVLCLLCVAARGALALTMTVMVSAASFATQTTDATLVGLNLPSPSSTIQAGQSVTLSGNVIDIINGGQIPNGNVTIAFGDGASATINLDSGGNFSTSHTYLRAGGFFYNVTYNGGPGNGGPAFQPSSSPLNANVINATAATTTTSLSIAPNPSAVGQQVTATVTLTHASNVALGGTVTVNFGDNVVEVGSAANSLSFQHTYTAPNSNYTVTATYSGDTNNQTSTMTVNQSVQNILISNTTIQPSPTTSQPGQATNFTVIVTGSGSTPTGSVTFNFGDGSALATLPLSSGAVTASHVFASSGHFGVTVTYSGDNAYTQSSDSLVQTVGGAGTTTTVLTSSLNPSSQGQAVTFTANVSGTSPTGSVTFSDGATTLGTIVLANGIATLTTSALAPGSHAIRASYAGDANNSASTATLTQTVNLAPDSIKLHQMQVSTMPVVGNLSGQAIGGAIGNAIDSGFSGNPEGFVPNGSGFTYYFNPDGGSEPGAKTTSDGGLKSYLASPDGRHSNLDDSFASLGYAGTTKAPPPGIPRDWLAWIDFRGTDYVQNTPGADLKGTQVNTLAGLTRRLTSDFLVGVFGGYEHFDFTSQAFNGHLNGDGWTVGTYLGWRLAPHWRFDAGWAGSELNVLNTAGTANGSFNGTRWLVTGGLTGTYGWQVFVIEPSARVYALWEHENAYTDSLGGAQPGESFSTGRASAGVKATYPWMWSSTTEFAPYVGLYSDYYFSSSNTVSAALTTTPLLQGGSVRATAGTAWTFNHATQISLGGELGGIGSQEKIWTLRARAQVPF